MLKFKTKKRHEKTCFIFPVTSVMAQLLDIKTPSDIEGKTLYRNYGYQIRESHFL